jgi:hypothetical protein
VLGIGASVLGSLAVMWRLELLGEVLLTRRPRGGSWRWVVRRLHAKRPRDLSLWRVPACWRGHYWSSAVGQS